METVVDLHWPGCRCPVDGNTEQCSTETFEDGGTWSGGYPDITGLFFLTGLERVDAVFPVVAGLVGIHGGLG